MKPKGHKNSLQLNLIHWQSACFQSPQPVLLHQPSPFSPKFTANEGHLFLLICPANHYVHQCHTTHLHLHYFSPSLRNNHRANSFYFLALRTLCILSFSANYFFRVLDSRHSCLIHVKIRYGVEATLSPQLPNYQNIVLLSVS